MVPGGKLTEIWVLWEQEKEKAAFLTTGRSHGYLGDIPVRPACTQPLPLVTVSDQPLANAASFSFLRADWRVDWSL